MGYNSHVKRNDAKRVKPEYYYDHFESLKGDQTNNTAEILAAKHAIEYVSSKGIQHTTLIMDSEYVLKTLNSWLDKYASNGWKKSNGETISNVKLWQDVYQIKHDYAKNGGKLMVSWVKGHSGEPGNEKADTLASIGVLNAAKGDTTKQSVETETNGYWKTEVDRHPFLLANYSYFNTGDDLPRKGVYYLGDNRLDTFQEGKSSSDVSLSVVWLKEPDKTLDIIQDTQIELANGLTSQIRTNLFKIYSPTIHSALNTWGKYSLSCPSKYRLNMSLALGTELTVEFRPLGLAGRTMDAAQALEEMLEQFILSRKGESKMIQFKDVTEHLYTTVEKSKGKGKEVKSVIELQKAITVTTTTVSLPIIFNDITKDEPVVKEINIDFVLGYDLLGRNGLKRLEAHAPKVYTITWSTSKHSFDYAIVIETKEGDIGIWAAPYTNHRVLVSS